MSEETTNETNDSGWSGLKKNIIATLTTVIAGGGVWVTTTLFGGHEEPKEETKTEQVAPVQQPIINLNVQQNQENKQKVENGGGTRVIERVVEKPAAPQTQPKKEEESW